MTDFELDISKAIAELKADFAAFGTNTPLPKREKAQRKARAEQDVVYFGETYFPHRVQRSKLFPDADIVTLEHREMLRLCGIKNIPKLFLAYRGFAKSTWATIIDTLHKLYFQRFQAGIIGSFDAKTAVNNFTSAIFFEIETNPRLEQDFGHISGSYRWGVSDFITRTGIRLAALGIGGMAKGFNNPLNSARLDLFKGDDLQKRESARSLKQVEALEYWLWEEVYLALREEVDGGSYMDISGTCVDGGTDYMTQLKEDTDRAMLKLIVPMQLDYPSVSIDTRDVHHVRTVYISEATGGPQWTSRYIKDESERLPQNGSVKDERTNIAEKRRNAGNAIHSAENLQHPLSAKHKVFRVGEWFHYLQPYGEIPVPRWNTHIQMIGRSDPSSTGKGDRKSIVVLSSSPDDWRIYVRHVFDRQSSVDEWLEGLMEVRLQFGCPVGVEENMLKDFLWRDIRRFEEDHQIDLMLFPIHNSLNKIFRIKQLQSPAQRGIFVFQKGHSDQDVLVDEADVFPEGRFDDGLDSWAGAYNDIMLLKHGNTQHTQRHSTGRRRTIQPVSMGEVLRGRA